LGTSATVTRALTLEWRADGSLWAVRDDEERPVSVRRCFPWSEPTRHLSLRDADEEEFALVRNPAELDPRSRAALETALAVAGFVFEVTRVLEIEEEVEIRPWQVGGDCGRRGQRAHRACHRSPPRRGFAWFAPRGRCLGTRGPGGGPGGPHRCATADGGVVRPGAGRGADRPLHSRAPHDRRRGRGPARGAKAGSRCCPAPGSPPLARASPPRPVPRWP